MKLIPGTTAEGMIHHVKGFMVNSTTEILILHCGTNDMKIDITS